MPSQDQFVMTFIDLHLPTWGNWESGILDCGICHGPVLYTAITMKSIVVCLNMYCSLYIPCRRLDYIHPYVVFIYISFQVCTFVTPVYRVYRQYVHDKMQ